jgi:PadR family transcriptional regulator PadR
MTQPQPTEFLQGTLDLLILRTLAWGPTHGYGVARWIQEITEDALRIEEGSLYPALHRLEKRRLIKSSWGLSENNRKAKFYELTKLGRDTLASESSSWSAFSDAVGKVLTSRQQPGWAK